ncbi:MAG: hypothetical protein JSR83_20225 [Proteobacteria bacterium]|nr:hypothetical protein [Pseudomonadota bacterium]
MVAAFLQASSGAIGLLEVMAQRLGKWATRNEEPDGIGTTAIAFRLRALLGTLQAYA